MTEIVRTLIGCSVFFGAVLVIARVADARRYRWEREIDRMANTRCWR